MCACVNGEMHIIGKHPIIIVIMSLGSINLFGFSMTMQFNSSSSSTTSCSVSYFFVFSPAALVCLLVCWLVGSFGY